MKSSRCLRLALSFAPFHMDGVEMAMRSGECSRSPHRVAVSSISCGARQSLVGGGWAPDDDQATFQRHREGGGIRRVASYLHRLAAVLAQLP